MDDIRGCIHTLLCHRKGTVVDEDFSRLAVEILVRRLSEQPRDLETLLTCILSNGATQTPCIVLPNNVDDLLQICGGKIQPHLLYIRIWRFPDAVIDELQPMPFCCHGYGRRVYQCCRQSEDINNMTVMANDVVCINPFHYERVSRHTDHTTDANKCEDVMSSDSDNDEPVGLVTTTSTLTATTTTIANANAIAVTTSGINTFQTVSRFPYANVELTGAHGGSVAFSSNDPLQCSFVDPSRPGSSCLSYSYMNPTMSRPYQHPHSHHIQLDSCASEVPLQHIPANSNCSTAQASATVLYGPSSDRVTVQQYARAHSLPQQPDPFLPSTYQGNVNNGTTLYNSRLHWLANSAQLNQNFNQMQRSSIPSLPLLKQPDFWCTIVYFELDQQVGESFKVARAYDHVKVDGYTDPSSPNRFCLGQLSNVHRTLSSEKSRLYIGQGIELQSMQDGGVWIRCLSKCSVFVKSLFLDREAGRKPGHAVHKIYHGAFIKVFDIRYCYHQMCEITRLDKEALLRQVTVLANATGTGMMMSAPVLSHNQSQGEQPHATNLNLQHSDMLAGVDDLRRLCELQLSFVKGWGPDYPRKSISDTPCWIEIRLHSALQLLDEVLQASSISTLKPTRHFFNSLP